MLILFLLNSLYCYSCIQLEIRLSYLLMEAPTYRIKLINLVSLEMNELQSVYGDTFYSLEQFKSYIDKNSKKVFIDKGKKDIILDIKKNLKLIEELEH